MDSVVESTKDDNAVEVEIEASESLTAHVEPPMKKRKGILFSNIKSIIELYV